MIENLFFITIMSLIGACLALGIWALIDPIPKTFRLRLIRILLITTLITIAVLLVINKKLPTPTPYHNPKYSTE